MNTSNIDQIKKLREETGAGIMDSKKALDTAKGDLKKAAEILKKQGILKASEKANRETGAGLIESYIHANGKLGVLIEVQCETDFVARTPEFKTLTHEIAMQIASMEPKKVEDLLKQVYIRDSSLTISDLIKTLIGKVGENIVVKRFERMELGKEI